MIDFLKVTEEILEEKPEKNFYPEEKALSFSLSSVIAQLPMTVDLGDMQEKASAQEVSCPKSAAQALSMALQARKMHDRMESSRKEALRPYTDFKKNADSFCKGYSNRLKDIEEDLKKKLQEWVSCSALLFFGDGLESLVVPDGTMSFSDVFSAEVEDKGLVPSRYLKVDMEQIEKDLKNGIKEIPGIKINTKKQVKLRVKNEK